MEEKVSIIIPNFNRAALIGATLESILKQDYENWECIIVDDHSKDNSIKVIEEYTRKDNRFNLLVRPPDRPKGANACRNFGYEQSSGSLINWFDSDDLMTPGHISALLKAIIDNDTDFAVGDSQNFSDDQQTPGKPYNFDRQAKAINAQNFARQSIGWITGDFLVKKGVIGQLRFNEKIQTDGDDYNFFVQFLCKNRSGIFVDETLTYRRVHSDNLSNRDKNSELDFYTKVASVKFLTFKDIEKFKDVDLLRWFLSGYMQYSFRISTLKKTIPHWKEAFPKISSYFGFRNALFFFLAVASARYTGRGYKFLRKAIRY